MITQPDSPNRASTGSRMQASWAEDDASAGRNASSAYPISNNPLPFRPGIHAAVNTAIDDSHADLDPKLVSKITEHVVSALKKEILSTPANASAASSTAPQTIPGTSTSSFNSHQSSQYAFTPTDRPATTFHHPTPSTARNTVPASPTSPASSQIPPRYTPPSPNRYEASSNGSSSPEPPPSDAGSYASKDTKNSRRDSKSSMSGQEDMNGSRHRMRPVRIPSSVEETSLEKAWKPLFENGKPTPRLGLSLIHI